RLVAHGPACHGSRPLRSNAVVHLARAIDKVAGWNPPSRLNETTNRHFSQLAALTSAEDAARYTGVLEPPKRAAAEECLADQEPALPSMSTGATDMAYLRSKGTQCYGIGPATDEEDGPKGFGAHSDQERVLESELHRFVRFNWEVVTALAGAARK